MEGIQPIDYDPKIDFTKLKCLDNRPVYHNCCENFIKFLQISPDGKALLYSSESTSDLHLERIESSFIRKYLYYKSKADCSSNSGNLENESDLKIYKSGELSRFHIGESIYDFKWYPYANFDDISTCCFISTSRDHPVQLWDTTGIMRASYVGYNQVDELDKTHCLAFNIHGDKIYCGSTRLIRCFDVAVPGANATEYKTSETRHAPDGQKGIISCLSFNPDQSGCFAAGSYSQSISIYVENMMGSALDLTNLGCGITNIKWSPCGNYLWYGGRNHCQLMCWDIRNTRSEIGRVHRALHTNQRLTFDIDPWGHYLATGSQDGRLLIYDTKSFELVSNSSDMTPCLNTVLFHPVCGLLFSSSGQREFSTFDDSSDDECESDNFIDHDSTNNKMLKKESKMHKIHQSGIQVWYVGYQSTIIEEEESNECFMES